ncbi:uncharacterized protein MONBRDRAFT_29468 [Monosiga brevicollis MX1]|uniref:Fibrinogen C-terminal domain-containing protein n=1 Tax=Monosiga brevicollis TaxID=81824 RepID=A9VB66_MONBE|nr:uncharacterized protein MONBRDRAFT_29468 [Monosiga brevicollis MX1]EDQ85185.1 predicted protein [Monosiga brevicollis MX1]|eukprot:XP_001750010.1 hypothetical protein [Monosiga brevicollis MX1]
MGGFVLLALLLHVAVGPLSVVALDACVGQPNGTACDDGRATTINDSCQNGTCAGEDVCETVVCTALSDCHAIGECIGINACSNPFKPAGASCGSNGGTCNGAGTCNEPEDPYIEIEDGNLVLAVNRPSKGIKFKFTNSEVDAQTLASDVQFERTQREALEARLGTSITASNYQALSNLVTTVSTNTAHEPQGFVDVSTLLNSLSQAAANTADTTADTSNLATTLSTNLGNTMTSVQSQGLEIDQHHVSLGQLSHRIDNVSSDVLRLQAGIIADLVDNHTTHLNLTAALSDLLYDLVDDVDAEAGRIDDLTTLTNDVSLQQASDATSLGGRITVNEQAMVTMQNCANAGQIWDGSACHDASVVTKDLPDAACTGTTEGLLRYTTPLHNLEICKSGTWMALSAIGIGTEQSLPAKDCEDLYKRGIRADGLYWVLQGGTTPFQAFCFLNVEHRAETVSFGTGADGDRVLDGGVHAIEDLYPGYNWMTGNVPNWNSLSLINGARLTCNKFNDKTTGGVIMFYVSSLLSICETCSIDASALGWSGGAAIYGSSGYGDNVRNGPGLGPGGGRGGVGGFSGWHGSGGGGGSFAVAGQLGTPDVQRNINDKSAVAGKTYGVESGPFWSRPVMGSGGGAGGPGHPSTSACAPKPGGHGGGAIQIAAQQIQNNGIIRANGGDGLPQGSDCSWPDGNPQVGSSGGGSGGLVRLQTSTQTNSFGAIEVDGGHRGSRQSWGNERNRAEGQRGGYGGAGRVYRLIVDKSCTGVCLHGRTCKELERRGEQYGYFRVPSAEGPIRPAYCEGEGVGVHFGTGANNNLELSGGVHLMEDVFPGYDPRKGIIPNYATVQLRDAAILTTSAYDPRTNRGGIVAFRAQTLDICDSCRIDVSELGWYGAWNFVTTVDIMEDTRNQAGYGPGGGTGGGGGNFNDCNAHGAGGGGGSFGTQGQTGSPDRGRCNGDYSAVGGPTYDVRAVVDFSPADAPLGSGGGAGGPGHSGTTEAYCAPGEGGRGGGAIVIAARNVVTHASFRAAGEQGNPKQATCRWGQDNGNPQAGSGGAGSGGLIHLFSENDYQLTYDINGGARPMWQDWDGDHDSQRGGQGAFA